MQPEPARNMAIEALHRQGRPLRIPADAKARLWLLFLAKHALGNGRPDQVDGNHVVQTMIVDGPLRRGQISLKGGDCVRF
jgi:hypothetical protein